MAKPILNSPSVHAIVTPTAANDYHAVVHADSGREVVRCATAIEAVKEQTRLNALDKK